MYDIYLGGTTLSQWREQFKNNISADISIFDPYVKKLSKQDKSEQVAREFYFMDQCEIIVFYINSDEVSKSARLQLGDAVGLGKTVIVCLDGNVEGKEYIQYYCEYRGVICTSGIEDLITTVESYIAEIELCNFEDEDIV